MSDAPAHPVQGEARDAVEEIAAKALWEDRWPDTPDNWPPPIPAVAETFRGHARAVLDAIGWDAHTAHAAAEVEQLKAERDELLAIVVEHFPGSTYADRARRLTEHGAEPR